MGRSSGLISASRTARRWPGLRSRFGFHPLDIEDLTTRSQRPKLDVHEEYLLLVLHFPSTTAKRKYPPRPRYTSFWAPTTW